MLVLRQTIALLRLTWLSWWRGAIPLRENVTKPMRATAIGLRLLLAVTAIFQTNSIAKQCARLPPESARSAFATAFLGLFAFGASYAAMTRAPASSANPGARVHRFVEVLPLSEVAKASVLVVTLVPIHLAAIVMCRSASGGASDLGVSVALGLLLSTAGILGGAGAMVFVRSLLEGGPPPRATMAARAGSFFSIILLVGAPSLGKLDALHHAPFPTYVLVDAVRGDASSLRDAIVGLSAFTTLFGLALYLGERRGYDRGEIVTTKRMGARESTLSLETLDRVLGRRTPGDRFTKTFVLVFAWAMAIGFAAFAWITDGQLRSHTTEIDVAFGLLASVLPAQMIATLAMRDANRDIVARPFFATLPLAPNVLLETRTRSYSRYALVVQVVPAGAFLVEAVFTHRVEPIWRAAALLAGGVLAARAMVAISFLRGATEERAAPQIETFLVLIPLLALVGAPSFFGALVALFLLGLVTREARVSSLACVRWIDDGDDFGRATETWRAALVLGVFFAAQTFTRLVLHFSGWSVARTTAGAYFVSCVVLVLLGSYERRATRPVQLRMTKGTDALLGVAGGGLSTGIAFAYTSSLRWFGVVLPAAPRTTDADFVWLALAAVVVAPLAEEYFFRGILQDAILRDDEKRTSAVAIGASAFLFAAIHPPLSFVPVFALGLVTASLFARTKSIVPGVLAHAIHNTAAVFLLT